MNTENKRFGKLAFYSEWPDKVMDDVLKYFKQVQWLIPAWCHVCVLTWDEREREAIMRVSVDSEYRRIYVTVGPQWISLDDAEKLNSARHELIHSFNTVIADYAIDEIKRMMEEVGDELYKESVLEQIKLRVEQATCDLEHCLDQVEITPKKLKN